jgi:CRISPR-associated endonuclease/helicase Cas3
MLRFYHLRPQTGCPTKRELWRTLIEAARFHDLGKLLEAFQAMLRGETKSSGVDHEDAGVAHLWARVEAAALASCHHDGLKDYGIPSLPPESERFRFHRTQSETDSRLSELLRLDESEIERWPTSAPSKPPRWALRGVTRRLLLSCLVDGDHTDSARHTAPHIRSSRAANTRWTERIAALDTYVSKLRPTKSNERTLIRQRLYDECRSATIEPPFRFCDAPVGTGKTTALMAHALHVASKKKLRRIFVVLPFTNIITQSVRVYRDALVLPGESAESVVAESHHLVDFEDEALRPLATLWQAPIVVTTAVQFFETLAASKTGRLRKLHALPGSVVILDEAHAALPSHLLPQAWQWLRALAHDWSLHLVLASGSLPRFWTMPEFLPKGQSPENVSSLVSDELAKTLEEAERRRVRVVPTPAHAYSFDALCTQLKQAANSRGPVLAIFNTVQTAAVVADHLRADGSQVLHLSSALAPKDRTQIVERIRQRLTSGEDRRWILVATSVVEAGMDFSFQSGFREVASAFSLLQTAGRISRGAEYENPELTSFHIEATGLITNNPGIQLSARVCREMLTEGAFHDHALSDVCAQALRRQLSGGDRERADEMRKREIGANYPEVAKQFRVIEGEDILAIVDPAVIKRLRGGEKVDPRDLQLGSVRFRSARAEELALEPLFPTTPNLRVWTYTYDPEFLGCMAGVLPIIKGNQAGLFEV